MVYPDEAQALGLRRSLTNTISLIKFTVGKVSVLEIFFVTVSEDKDRKRSKR